MPLQLDFDVLIVFPSKEEWLSAAKLFAFHAVFTDGSKIDSVQVTIIDTDIVRDTDPVKLYAVIGSVLTVKQHWYV